jgi:hypothetical protein
MRRPDTICIENDCICAKGIAKKVNHFFSHFQFERNSIVMKSCVKIL